MNRDHLRWSTVLWAVEKPVLSKYSMTHLEIKGRSGTLLSNYSLCVCVCVCVYIQRREKKRKQKRKKEKAKCYKWHSQHRLLCAILATIQEV